MSSPQTYNRYAYTANNPYKYVDPDGRVFDYALDAAGIAYDIHEIRTQGASFKTVGILVLDVVLAVAPVVPTIGGVKLGAKGLSAAADVSPGRMGQVWARAKNWVRGASGRSGGATEAVSPRARGRASEARVLDDLGLPKNNQRVSTAEGNAIPDALTPTHSVEIKDAACVSCTAQIRIETGAASATGRQSVLVTGTNTHVTGPARRAFDEIITRGDLGPQ